MIKKSHYKISRLFIATILSISCLIARSQRLVLPGDHPDPSVVKIGDAYWASATTSNWMPAYPLFKSTDLLHWKAAGNVFNTLPAWADFYFWAPEITYEKGKVYIYYAAHKKDGNLCIGVASADKPEGPYMDHGPLICQTVGSIDAFPMRDEKGKLYLIWKEDANSVKKPTPIWIQELNEERTALLGEKKELFRNSQPWEGNLVEGVSMIRHGDYFYAFYAAAGCCGLGCNYTTGVARSKSLLGPWEKKAEPILVNDGRWKCPGHGTPIEKDGRFYFLYHAYDTAGSVYTGREGLLQEFRFTPDNWVAFVKESPTDNEAQTVADFRIENAMALWQWSVFQNVPKKIKGDKIELGALPAASGAFVGQKTFGLNYEARVTMERKKSSAAAGLSLIGDEGNIITAFVKDDQITIVQVRDNKENVLFTETIPRKKAVSLSMQVRNGKDIDFLYSIQGKKYKALNKESINGAYLPPWDRALRVGVAAKGPINQKAVFKNFSVN